MEGEIERDSWAPTGAQGMNPSILVVDDDVGKVDRIVRLLVQVGVRDEDVLTVRDAAAARRALGSRHFDLMLLDVLLPVREGSQPHGDVSVELLRQIVEDNTVHSPSHIVAVTAEPGAARDHQEGFRDLVTQVLHVGPGDSEWERSLSLLIQRLRRGNARDAYECDIAIVTALRSPELEPVLSLEGSKWGPEESIARGVVARTGSLLVGGNSWKAVCAHAPQVGSVAAFHVCMAVTSHFRPKVLAMVGICGGIASDIRLGDVVIATSSWDWQSGKWDQERGLLFEGTQRHIAPELLSVAHGTDLTMAHREFVGEKPDYVPGARAAPMVSGSSVISNGNLHTLLRAQHRKIAAVDMECFGVYFAAGVSETPFPMPVCIKSISDLADSQKDDKYHKFCSAMSVATLMSLLERWQIASGSKSVRSLT